MRDWREGCERCKQILRYGGMGHTMSIHSQNEQVILEFGLKKPAFRIVVNTPTTHGSIGLTTGLDPAMTLGLRRLRREHHVRQHLAAPSAEHQASGVRIDAGRRAGSRRPPAPVAAASPAGSHRGRADPANRQLPGLARLSGRKPRDPGKPMPGGPDHWPLPPLRPVERHPSTSSARTTSGRLWRRAGRL